MSKQNISLWENEWNAFQFEESRLFENHYDILRGSLGFLHMRQESTIWLLLLVSNSQRKLNTCV